MLLFTQIARYLEGAARFSGYCAGRVGRGLGVERGLGVGEHLPTHGVGVGVAVGVTVGVGVGVGVPLGVLKA